MSIDLDLRIANLPERKRAGDRESEHSVLELGQSVKSASLAIKELEIKADAISQCTGQLEAKLRNIRRMAVTGLVMTVCIALLVIMFALWTGARIRPAAVDEAMLVSEQNANLVAELRQQQEEEVAALRAQNAEQRERAEKEVAEAGAELADMARELGEGRSELAQFIALREKAGFNLFDNRGRAILIVAKGREIRSWRAPGISSLAQYNGQMYQVMGVKP